MVREEKKYKDLVSEMNKKDEARLNAAKQESDRNKQREGMIKKVKEREEKIKAAEEERKERKKIEEENHRKKTEEDSRRKVDDEKKKAEEAKKKAFLSAAAQQIVVMPKDEQQTPAAAAAKKEYKIKSNAFDIKQQALQSPFSVPSTPALAAGDRKAGILGKKLFGNHVESSEILKVPINKPILGYGLGVLIIFYLSLIHHPPILVEESQHGRSQEHAAVDSSWLIESINSPRQSIKATTNSFREESFRDG